MCTCGKANCKIKSRNIDQMIHGDSAYNNFGAGILSYISSSNSSEDSSTTRDLKRPEDAYGTVKAPDNLKTADLLKNNSLVNPSATPKYTIKQSSLFSDFLKKNATQANKATGSSGGSVLSSALTGVGVGDSYNDIPDKKSGIGKYLVIGGAVIGLTIFIVYIAKK